MTFLGGWVDAPAADMAAREPIGVQGDAEYVTALLTATEAVRQYGGCANLFRIPRERWDRD